MSAPSTPGLPAGISLEQIAASLGQALLITDTSGRILFVNDAFLRATGYAAAEVIGQNPRMLQSGRHSPGFYRRMWRNIRLTGRWDGEIINRRKDGRLFTEWITISAIHDAQGQVTHYLGIFRDITRHRRAIDATRHRAEHDALTGLANRTLFHAYLEQAIARARRSGGKVGVLFFDLDHFKQVNDILGHEAGDVLLKEIAGRLRRSVREADLLCRYGGDEFVMALVDVPDAAHAERVAEKMVAALRRPIPFGSMAIRPTVSTGMSVFPEDGLDAESLLHAADAAMYRAKRSGRNRICRSLPETFHD